MSDYSEKLKDPRWQKKRLQILERDQWCCQRCFDPESTLHVHHRNYSYGKDPWDYDDDNFVTLCEECHNSETEYRKESEKALIDICRERFFYDTVHGIACAINQLPRNKPEDFFSLLLHKITVSKERYQLALDLFAFHTPVTVRIPIKIHKA